MVTSSRDRGSISVFVVGLAMSFMVVAGLAVDGGRIVSARVSAADHAENAARVGAQQVTLIRLGWRVLDPARARQASMDYLAFHGVSGTVDVGINSVTVRVVITQPTTLLRLVGISSRTVSASRTATLESS
jgi:Putative Flp pilus-assembly TadE/G-like